MKKFSVAICDDEEVMSLAVENLVTEAFAEAGTTCTVEYFGDAARLAQAYKRQGFDLILLDIEMPGTDGLSFARALRKYEKDSGAGRPADIIYISNHDEKVFDTFMVKPFAFIRKSRILTEGKKVLKLYAESVMSPSGDDTVEFKSGPDYIRLSAGEIVYVENSVHDQIIHLGGGRNVPRLRTTLTAVEEVLSPYGFIRVHASYLVNFKYISRVSAGSMELTTGETVPVSRSRKKAAMGEFLRLSREKNMPGL